MRWTRGFEIVGVAAFLAVAVSACSSSSGEGSESAASDLSQESATPIGPEPSGTPTRYPIILVHGFKASPEKDGFWGIAEALRADGHTVYVARTPPFQSADIRAKYLQETVDQALADGATKVNLIAHSMGGLDSRALISTLGYGDRVATLTTMSTPHRGSASIDAIMGFVDGLGVPDKLLDCLGVLWGRVFSTAEVAQDSDVRAAFLDLSEAHAQEWNDAHPDDRRVVYQSIAGVSNAFGIVNPLDMEACDGKYYVDRDGHPAYPGGGRADEMPKIMQPLASAVSHMTELRPNDALVTVESAHWGNFLGCVPANHLLEPGEPGLDVVNARTGFDPVRFFRNLAFDLARQGF